MRRLLALLLLLSPDVAGAWAMPVVLNEMVAGACADGDPRISIEMLPSDWRLEHRYSIAEIDAYAKGSPVALEAEATVIGLTSTVMTAAASFLSDAVPARDGTWCVSLSTVEVRMGFPEPIVVFVPREYPEGSCAYDAVLRHELEHVSIYISSLERSRDKARQEVADGIRGFRGKGAGDTAEAANARVSERLTGVVQHMVQAVNDGARRANEAIDTPEEYARVFASCPEWGSRS